jgi:hypothetical protein
MTPAEMFVEDMRQRFASDPAAPLSIEQADVDQYAGTESVGELGLYNEVARILAQGFHSGNLSFDFCDAVVNSLYGVLIAGQMREPQPPWPILFHEVFSAFDEGEFHHREDAEAADPITLYTKPMIERIVVPL